MQLWPLQVIWLIILVRASQVALVVKNPPANAGDIDSGSIPGSGRSPGGGKPLQYSCLEKPMDRGAWRGSVHRVTKSQTRLKQLSTYACILVYSHWIRMAAPTSQVTLNLKQLCLEPCGAHALLVPLLCTNVPLLFFSHPRGNACMFVELKWVISFSLFCFSFSGLTEFWNCKLGTYNYSSLYLDSSNHQRLKSFGLSLF